MRQIVIIIIATLLFIGSGVLVNHYLSKSADNIAKHVNNIGLFAKNQDWNQVNKELNLSKENWDQSKDKWAMLVDHIEIDNINTSISKVEKYVETQSIPDLLAESENLKLLINHIPERDALSIKNVL